MASETIKKIQDLQQKLLVYEEYLNIYKQRLIEINVATNHLKKAKEKGINHAYQAVGANILIKRPIDDILSELDSDRTLLTEKIKDLETEVTKLKQQLRQLSSTTSIGSS